jgi:hypothetical protein
MKGLRLETGDDISFEQLFAPVMSEFEAFHWLLDGQNGPFNYTGRADWASVEAALQPFVIESGQTSTSLWRPGVFPRFAGLLLEDEWSYFVGIHGTDAEARRAMAELMAVPVLSAAYFNLIGQVAQVFLMRVAAGWWEMYPESSPVLAAIRQRKGLVEVDSSVWPHGPVAGRSEGPAFQISSRNVNAG